jgi:DNA-binding XRE family transcriptional regulator
MYFDRKKMRALREKEGLSQEALAQKIAVSSKNYYSWESGRALPSLKNYFSLCEHFGEYFDGVSQHQPPTIEEERSEPA